MMQFCPVCKKLLEIKKINEKNIYICSCGFKRFIGVDLSSTEKTSNTLKGDGIISENNSIEGIFHSKKILFAYAL